MDSEVRILPAAVEVKCCCPERVILSAGDTSSILSQPGLAFNHARSRSPRRPFGLATNNGASLQSEAFLTNCDAIACGTTLWLDVVEVAFIRVDDDRAWRLGS